MPTLVVKRLVMPGHEKQYEHSIGNLIAHAERMDGYMGINIARPASKKHPLYVFSAKFDTVRNLQKFKESDFRKACLKELQGISLAPIKERTINKLDWWFALPGSHFEIPHYKMILVTILAIYPIVFALNMLFYPMHDVLETAVKTLFVVIVTITVMSYITLPLTLKLLQRWLHPYKSKIT